MTPHQRKISATVSHLLEWYPKNARDLPWRRSRDPYAIWVSEIMLQQTQVNTVMPYWERWMQALPDIAALAKADSQTLHKLWEGLGYYSRVRNLHRAAGEIVQLHSGRFPERFEEILELPGIGPYTAGAIASIAFNQARPILDGNVIRVLARVWGLGGDPRSAVVRDQLWQTARELVEAASKPAAKDQTASRRRHCADLNQALMELGALICTPRQPQCEVCPLRADCKALLTQSVDALPALPKRPKTTRRYFQAYIVERRGKFLVRQRGEGAVNALLWEFPNVETGSAKADPREHSSRLLGSVSTVEPIATFQHSITRYRIQVQVYRVAGVHPRLAEGRWVSRGELSALPCSSAHRRIARLAAEPVPCRT